MDENKLGPPMEEYNLGPLPKIDPRHVPVAIARGEFDKFLMEWCQRNNLTESEYLMLLTDEVARCVQWRVRAERRQAKEKNNG